MKSPSSLLKVVSGLSVGLLLVGALLAITGISNAFLNWHSFSRGTEKIFFAVFWSTLTLAAFSVCTTLVVGIREAVRLFGPASGDKPGKPAKRESSSFGVYLRSMGLL